MYASKSARLNASSSGAQSPGVGVVDCSDITRPVSRVPVTAAMRSTTSVRNGRSGRQQRTKTRRLSAAQADASFRDSERVARAPSRGYVAPSAADYRMRRISARLARRSSRAWRPPPRPNRGAGSRMTSKARFADHSASGGTGVPTSWVNVARSGQGSEKAPRLTKLVVRLAPHGAVVGAGSASSAAFEWLRLRRERDHGQLSAAPRQFSRRSKCSHAGATRFEHHEHARSGPMSTAPALSGNFSDRALHRCDCHAVHYASP